MLPETLIGRRLLLRTALRIDAVPLRRLQASSAVDACVGKAFNWSSNRQASFPTTLVGRCAPARSSGQGLGCWLVCP